MDLSSHKREMHRGFGDALVRPFEFAATLALFVGLGWVIDGWLDTRPLFMIVLLVVGVVGVFARLWYGYEAQMRRQEAAYQQARDR